MDFNHIARELIPLLGGKENIASAAHCATRLRLVLVDDARYLLQRVQEVRGGGVRVSHRQMPVVVVVPEISLHHKTVVGKFQSVP